MSDRNICRNPFGRPQAQYFGLGLLSFGASGFGAALPFGSGAFRAAASAFGAALAFGTAASGAGWGATYILRAWRLALRAGPVFQRTTTITAAITSTGQR